MNRTRRSVYTYNLNSPWFPYVLGSYQAVTSRTNQQYFKLTARTKSLEQVLRTAMLSVFGIDNSECLHKDTGSLSFLVCSIDLMEFLDRLTHGNTVIPVDYISSSPAISLNIHEYIKGFFDQRAMVITRTKHIKESHFIRKIPSIRIKKRGNREILMELRKTLNSLGFNLPPATKKAGSEGCYGLSINRRRDIRKVIDLPLFASQEKLEKLRVLYASWIDLMAEDKYGVLGRRLLKATREKTEQELVVK